jgi:hypothetical protein
MGIWVYRLRKIINQELRVKVNDKPMLTENIIRTWVKMGKYKVDCKNCKSMTKQFKGNWHCKHEHMEFETSNKCFNKNETNQDPSQYIQNILIMTNLVIKFKEFTKNRMKIDGQNHHTKDKKESQKNANRFTTQRNQRRERVSPYYGRTLFHPQPL